MQDYVNHLDDTYFFIDDEEKIEKHMYPGLIGVLAFNNERTDWILSVPGLEPYGLGIPESDATNEMLIAELSTSLVVYKARIVR